MDHGHAARRRRGNEGDSLRRSTPSWISVAVAIVVTAIVVALIVFLIKTLEVVALQVALEARRSPPLEFDTGTHEAGKVCIPDDLPSFMRQFGDAMSKAESFIKKGKALVANHVEEVSKGRLSESDAKPSKEPPNDLLNRRTGDRLEKMLSPKNLEGKNKIFIPVLDVKMEHWFMVVIDISNKLKYVLDSLTPKTSNPLSIVVLESLEGHLKTAGYDISEYKAIYPIVAPQHNIYDCGFHMLSYARMDVEQLDSINKDT
ncbi:hypothetical protein ACP70R_045368 [Stipagrostis hirtigluma subsp. patula]